VTDDPARRRVVLLSSLAKLGREHLVALEAPFKLVERYDLDATHDEAALMVGLVGAWAVVAGSETYTERVLSALPELRLIVRCGVGFDAIDVPAATARRVAVATTPDANSDGVADLTLALMLACLRRIAAGDRHVRSGKWRLAGLSGDLTGATVGLVGLGRVGRNVVRRLAGFGCRIVAFEPYPDRDFCAAYDVELVELDALLPQVDVLSIHVPLTSETRHLIGAPQFSLLEPTAIVVNTSRGSVVDEPALVEALTEGRIAGAGLDVYEHEPLDVGHPLVALDNVVLSAHAASFTRLSVARMLASVSASLVAAAAGELPLGCVNPEAWPSSLPDS
jgi:phosphoglycerate dehydrogenase-like enzyme